MTEFFNSETNTVTNEFGGVQSYLGCDFTRIPIDALFEVARVIKQGADRYPDFADGRGNWTAIPIRDHINHAIAHLYSYLAKDACEDHLSHAAVRLLFALQLDIRFFYKTTKTRMARRIR